MAKSKEFWQEETADRTWDQALEAERMENEQGIAQSAVDNEDTEDGIDDEQADFDMDDYDDYYDDYDPVD